MWLNFFPNFEPYTAHVHNVLEVKSPPSLQLSMRKWQVWKTVIFTSRREMWLFFPQFWALYSTCTQCTWSEISSKFTVKHEEMTGLENSNLYLLFPTFGNPGNGTATLVSTVNGPHTYCTYYGRMVQCSSCTWHVPKYHNPAFIKTSATKSCSILHVTIITVLLPAQLELTI